MTKGEEGSHERTCLSVQSQRAHHVDHRLTLEVRLDVRQVRVGRLERRLRLDQLERVGLGRADGVLGSLADGIGLIEGPEAPGEGDAVAPVTERGECVGEAGSVAGLGCASEGGKPALGSRLGIDIGRELDADLLMRRKDGLRLELVPGMNSTCLAGHATG